MKRSLFLSGNGWVLFFYLHQMWPKPSPTLTCPYLKLIVSGIDETSCSNINFWGVEFLAQMNLNVLLSTLKKGLAASLPSARSAILTAQRKLFLIFKTWCTVSSAWKSQQGISQYTVKCLLKTLRILIAQKPRHIQVPFKSIGGKFEPSSKKRERKNRENGYKSPTCACVFPSW